MESATPSNTEPQRASRSKALIYGALGCVVGFLAGIGTCGIGSVFGLRVLSQLGAAPTSLAVNYEMPTTVRLGQEFTLALTLTNTGEAEFAVGDIDLDEMFDGSILEGTEVISSDPPMERDDSVPGVTTFPYNRPIPAGDSRTVVFRLRATTVGTYSGTFGVYVGSKSQHIGPLTLTVTE